MVDEPPTPPHASFQEAKPTSSLPAMLHRGQTSLCFFYGHQAQNSSLANPSAHWLSFSLLYMSSICGQMLAFLDRMSPGPTGLQDCAGSGWWAMIWQTANHSLAGSSALGTGPQRMVIPLWSFLCEPKASGQWQCFPSQRLQYAYQGHYFALGRPQASLYKGPGCDLRSA